MIKTNISRQKLIDGYVIFSLFLIPSSFLGLVSFRFFYVPGLFDLRLLSWLLAIPLLIIYGHKLKAISKTTSGKILILVVLFIIVRFIISLTQGIQFKEAFTVFRMGFNTPISCIAYFCFFYSIENDRIERIFKWGFSLFGLALFLYFINYLGLGIFENIKNVNEETQGGITIIRNLTGFPIYFHIFFIIGLYFVLNGWGIKYFLITLLSLFVIYISATRNFIIVYSVILIVIISFYIFKYNAGYFKKTILLLIASSMFLGLVISFKSDVYRFLQIKFESTVNVEFKEDIGTYAYRKRLIETSVVENRLTNSSFFGKGYTREGKKRSYKFVLGGDTMVAPVLFCEGFLGLAVRVFPVFYFLLFAFRNIRKTGLSQFVGISIFALIVSSAIAYVQTSIFYNYVDFILFFFVAQRYLENQNDFISDYD